MLLVEHLESRDVPAADYHFLPVFPAADPAVLDAMRSVAVVGQSLGRRTDVFLKIGDSNTEFPFVGDVGYLRPFTSPTFDPALSGLSAFGQNLVDAWAAFRYAPGVENSFARMDATAYPGFTTAAALENLGRAIGESNAGVALIMLGTNDAFAGVTPQGFRETLEKLVAGLINAGIVPILSTVPEDLAFGGSRQAVTLVMNQVIADAAADWRVPLWNFHQQLAGLPASGLGPDLLHLGSSPNGGARFSGGDLLYGQNQHNLGALVMLDWYRRNVAFGSVPFVAPLPGWTSLAGRVVHAVGRDAGQMPVVSVFDSATLQELNRFYAFEPSFIGGVRVAVADVDGDSIPDIVCGAGPTGGPVIAVFSGRDGSRLATIAAFESLFRGGVGSVAARDLDGDGKAEIAVGAGNGGGPVIAIYSGGTFDERGRFAAYDINFRGGVNVTLGQFEKLGWTIVAGAGLGGGPNVRFFRAETFELVRSYFADWVMFAGGIAVVAGDLNGDGFDELAAGRATGGSAVTIIDPATLRELRRIPARTTNTIAGVRLATTPAGLVAANGPGTVPSLDLYSELDAASTSIPPNDPFRGYGLFVG